MKRYFLIVLFFFSFSMIQAQNVSPWKRVPATRNLAPTRPNENGDTKKGLFFELDKSIVKNSLDQLQGVNKTKEVVIEIPNPNGDLEKYEIHEFSNFDAELQAQFPSIRSYIGKSVSDKLVPT